MPFARCFHGGKNAERADGAERAAAARRKERASSASEED